MSQGYKVTVNEENCDVTVVAPALLALWAITGRFSLIRIRRRRCRRRRR